MRTVFTTIFLLMLLLVAGYVAYPYIVLNRLDEAIRSDDMPALEALVDWPRLRANMKADLHAELSAYANAHASQGGVAAIGTAIAALLAPTAIDALIDQDVTPHSFATNALLTNWRSEGKSLKHFVAGSFFNGLTSFRVTLRDPNRAESPTVFLIMRLEDNQWRVTALQLPPIETWDGFSAALAPPSAPPVAAATPPGPGQDAGTAAAAPPACLPGTAAGTAALISMRPIPISRIA